jgi:hypothetical protein
MDRPSLTRSRRGGRPQSPMRGQVAQALPRRSKDSYVRRARCARSSSSRARCCWRHGRSRRGSLLLHLQLRRQRRELPFMVGNRGNPGGSSLLRLAAALEAPTAQRQMEKEGPAEREDEARRRRGRTHMNRAFAVALAYRCRPNPPTPRTSLAGDSGTIRTPRAFGSARQPGVCQSTDGYAMISSWTRFASPRRIPWKAAPRRK